MIEIEESKGADAMKKTISVQQMAAVLGYTSTAVRECIALGRYPFAQCWKTPGHKGRTFVIDRLGFTFYLAHTLGWSAQRIAAEFKDAGLEYVEELRRTQKS